MLRAIDLLDQRVRAAQRRSMPLDGEDFHPKWPDPCGNCAADVAISDDSDGLARLGHDVKSLPHASLLIANHAAEVFGEIQNRSERKLAQRCAKYAGPISERHGTFRQLREQGSLQAHRAGMHPTQVWAHSKHISEQGK